jgi:signal transduction histidine kinase
MQADGRSVPLGRTSRLAAGIRRIDIEYTALSLVAPDKVLFRYRLAGFDDDWIDAGTLRRVSYTHLPPGAYRFEVIASNNDGVWNEQGDRFDFSVAPFFYQTRWFSGAIGILVVAIGWGLHALRVRDLRMRNATLLERAALSQEIHDHISQIMTGIGLQIDAAREGLAQGSSVSGAHLERANRLARQGIEETRLILCSLQQGSNGRRPADTQLDDAFVESVARLIEGTGVRLRATRKGEPFILPSVVKDEIFNVGQEAVANALRHAQPRTIDIVIAFEKAGVRLTVEDDGRGFEPCAIQDGAGKGLGLAGMAARVARQRGTFDVRSRPGAGTTVTALFPRDARRRWV